MRLTESFMQVFTGNTDSDGIDSNRKSVSGNSNFGEYLLSADRSTGRTESRQNDYKTDNKNNNKANSYYENNRVDTNKNVVDKKNDSIKSSDNTEKKDASNVTDKNKNGNEVSEKNKVEDKKKIDEAKKVEELEKANKEAVEKLARELGVSPEVINQILAEMEITALELSDNNNLNEFAVKLLDVETKFDLLNVPEAKETIDTIKNVMAEYDELVNMENFDSLIKEVKAKMETDINISNSGNDGEKSVTGEVKNPLLANQGNGESEIDSNVLRENSQMANGTTNKEGIVHIVSSDTSGNESSMFSQNGDENANMLFDEVTTEGDVINFNPNVKQNEEIEFVGKNPVVKTAMAEDVIQQVADKIKVDIRTDSTEIRIMLKPEQLGEVSLKVAMQNGIVTAQFIAENEKVKEILESGFNELKESLNQQGVNIDQLSVSVKQQDSRQAFEQYNSSSQRFVSSKRINQILEGIEEDEIADNKAYVYDNEVYGAQYDYKA